VALAADCALACGAMGKIARDIALMTQSEVGEAVEPAAPGRGGSTAMPHKRNPVLSMRIIAATQPIPGMLAGLLAAMPQEHERAIGNWQAEMGQYPELLRHALAAGHVLAELLEGVRFEEARCRANIDALQGTIFSEQLAALAAAVLGKPDGQALVSTLCARAVENRRHLRDLVHEQRVTDQRLAGVLPGDVDAAFDVERAARASARHVPALLESVASLDL
jgi:3-carboxy-cis,cis-muconate cycloisomerase